MEQYELYHHGVKGQKWGVRRYQNPDGTLTDAGKKKIKELNELQRDADKKRIDDEWSKKHKKRTMVGNVFAMAAIFGPHAVMGVASGGASLPFSIGSVGLIGAASAYNVKYYKDIPKKTEQIIKKLESEGVKVSARETEFHYTYYDEYKGKTMSKRYNADGNTKPYVENYEYTQH